MITSVPRPLQPGDSLRLELPSGPREPAAAETLVLAAWRQLVRLIHVHQASDVFFDPEGISLRVSGEVHPVALPGDGPQDLPAALLASLNRDERVNAGLDSSWRAPFTDPRRAADFAVTIEGTRFRVNLFHSVRGLSAALRPLSDRAEEPARWGVPPEITERILRTESGLVLVTGPTGSGKTTTVSSLIEQINLTRRDVIVTIEDPVEILFQPKLARVYQREIGQSCASFADGLRSALRQNPDVIFVGEIRDPETAVTALRAAEAGHLVFATLHTRDVTETVTRLLDMTPGERRTEMRTVLANVLQVVLCQRLLRRKQGGRTACREILVANVAARQHVREAKEFNLPNLMLQGRAEGMLHWNRALEALRGVVTEEEFERHYRR